MVLFNYSARELTAKIVYYGPGLCGKTVSLQSIYKTLPEKIRKGKMLSLTTKTDRTLFFDFLPIELGHIRGFRTRFQLYTVPGQVFYNSTRILVLKGVDGIIFVADSQKRMLESNLESYRNLEENLGELGIALEDTPLVLQFNKRDLPDLLTVEEMNSSLNRHNAPFYESVATSDIGVEDTLKAVTKLVLTDLSQKFQMEQDGSRSKPAAPAKAAPVPAKTPPASGPPGGGQTGQMPAVNMAAAGKEDILELDESQVVSPSDPLSLPEPIPLEEATPEILSISEGEIDSALDDIIQVEPSVIEDSELIPEDLHATAVHPAIAEPVNGDDALPTELTLSLQNGGEVSVPLELKIQGRTVLYRLKLTLQVIQENS